MNLICEDILINGFPHEISSVGSSMKYIEGDAGAKIIIESTQVGSFNDNKLIFIEFFRVAKVVCVTVNFFEFNYKCFNLFLKSGDALSHPETGSGLYIIKDSRELAENGVRYDPSGSIGLSHFLIASYDCYYEVIANSYSAGYC